MAGNEKIQEENAWMEECNENSKVLSVSGSQKIIQS